MSDDTILEWRFKYHWGYTEMYRDRDKLYREWRPDDAELEYRKVTTTEWDEVGPAILPDQHAEI